MPDPIDPQNHQATSVLRPLLAAPSQIMSFRNHLYSEQAVDLGRATLHLEIEAARAAGRAMSARPTSRDAIRASTTTGSN